MGILDILARRRHRDSAAHQLYLDAVTQARAPGFYIDYGIPDTVEARFAMVSLHVHLLCRRLSKEGGASGGALAQTLFDTMFADIDRNLRELGVGDLAVGKKIKKLAGGHYTNAQRIEWALEDEDEDGLGQALIQAISEESPVSEDQKQKLAAYVKLAIEALDGQAGEALLSGKAAFPAVAS